jgi:cysteine sulfinate desulfinase/cysteine desulfurase-like protein
MNDNNNDINDPISKEEVAIINAAFRLLSIVVDHRIYRRRGGRSLFTRAALEQAKLVLADLRPSTPGTNPIKVAAALASKPEIAAAAVKLAIAETKQAKRRLWDKVRAAKADEVQNLSETSPLFKMFSRLVRYGDTIRELTGRPDPQRIADLAVALALKVDRELHPVTASVEAA